MSGIALRAVLASCLALAVTLTIQSLGWAELPYSPASSITIGPTSRGPVITEGTAGFGNAGIAAAASASTPQTGSQQNLSAGLTFTYTPIPDNTLVTVGPPQANNGVIAKPGTGFQ